MTFVFSLTLFVSSCLLFFVEPMFARMALPLLGGSPAVWNTCMLFFQTALLAGYAYAHLVIARLKPLSQMPVHLLVILLPLAVLPVRIGAAWKPPVEQNPIPWLVLLMLACVGLPFFAISTTASVMQKWFSLSGGKSARDPYFLYVASNAGGIAGLIGYIVIVEPNLTLAQQSRLWSIGYGVLIALTVGCALFLVGHNLRGRALAAESEPAAREQVPPVPLARQLWWVALAFAPSSLMLGVTTFISTNISAVPLLWVIPLTIYLLTFVIAFSHRSLIPARLAARLLPVLVVLVLIILAEVRLGPHWVPSAIHIFTFFVAALACHGQLAQDRPHTRHLTGYYLLIAVGGALGGVFNAIVAPLVFKTTAEHTIALVAACMLCRPDWAKARAEPSTAAAARFSRFDILVPLALGMLTAGLSLAAWMIPQAMPTGIIVVGALTGILCLALIKRPVGFGLAVAAVLLASNLTLAQLAAPSHRERSFFGILRVSTVRALKMRILMHGNTLHGMQSIVPGQRRMPRAFYFPTGPIGQVFAAFSESDVKTNVAVIGLGTGALAGYAEPGQTFTFYEIDPAVERIASDPRYFTYLKDARSRGADVRVVLGDGRLRIADAPARAFDLIVLDAFSSDAIPVHLLTRQALRVYLSKLSRGGLIAVHISNRFLDFAPVIGDLAADADLVCLCQHDQYVSPDEARGGKYPSTWVVLARRSEDLGSLFLDPRWQLVAARPSARVWTDDYSNILQVLNWR